MGLIEDAVQKVKGMSFPGSSVEDGKLYHEIPGLSFPFHRPGTRERVEQILEYVPVKGKKVLDIGCSAGGISLGLAAAGAEVTGVDIDVQSLEVAQIAATKMGLDVRFERMDILKDEVKDEYDIILWLSQWMWCVKETDLWPAVDLLHTISRKCQTLVFESAAEDGSAGLIGASHEDIRSFLEYAAVQETIVTVPPVKGWFDRPLHVCVHPETSWETPFAIINRSEVNKVSKIFKPVMDVYWHGVKDSYPWMKEREAEAMRRLEGKVGFPQLHQEGEDRVDMTWCGWSSNVTGDMWGQARGILKKLGEAGIKHRDIKPGNLLALNGILHLIDFSWCLFDDEEDTPDPAPDGLNCEEENDWVRWGNSDEEAMARSFDWILKKEKNDADSIP